jgi:hypothetical protein
MLSEIGQKLILRYQKGQFTFRNFNNSATSERLHELAMLLNAFQQTPVRDVHVVRTFNF